MRGRSRIVVSAATLLVLAGGLGAATGARSSARAASWAWQESVPGDPATSALQMAAASAGASRASVRELAVADGFALVAASENGALMIGPASGDQAQLAPLAQAVGDQPLAVYAAAAPDGAQQQLVGVARSDVDRVEALLADGTEQQLPLNQWRGFDYVAASPDKAAVGVLAYSGGDSLGAVRLPQTTTQSQSTSAAVQPIYGVYRTSLRDQALMVAAVDPRTLQPKAGPTLRLRLQWVGSMALSPDGSELALTGAPGPTNGRGFPRQHVMVVNLASMKEIRAVVLKSYATMPVLSWTESNRLIEIQQVMSQPYQRDVRSRTARIIDPTNGRLIAQHPLTNKLAIRTTVSTPLGLVLLLGSSGWHGPNMQLDLVTPAGGVRTMTIPVGTTKSVTRNSVLAVDRSSGHAYLVVAGGTVFDVDLHSMTTTRHVVPPPAGSSIVPPPVSRLQAQMFAGKLAVASLFHLPHNTTMPTQGVYLIDPATWTATVLDPTANQFTAFGDRLLTYGLTTPPHGVSPATLEMGHGLSLYDASGRLVSHLYGSRRFQYLALVPGYGHIIYNGSHSVTLNPKSGRVSFLGPNDQLIFSLATGAALGGGKISSAKPPLGPPILIFRGSQAVGEG